MSLSKEQKKLLEDQDLYFDLMDRRYWDMGIKGSYRVVQTRQEYDKKTCEAIIQLIIDCISHGCNDER